MHVLCVCVFWSYWLILPLFTIDILFHIMSSGISKVDSRPMGFL